jgi:hypothetical protein
MKRKCVQVYDWKKRKWVQVHNMDEKELGTATYTMDMKETKI